MFQFRIVWLGSANNGDVDIEEWASIGWHVNIWLVATSHIDSDSTSMSHSVIPCPHGVIFIDGCIVKFSDITGGIDAWDVAFQAFIDYNTPSHFDRSLLQRLCV